jgi:CheY-like chemotaxis protein
MISALKVFVVEDEAMIRMMVVDMLEELGHTVVVEAGHLDRALEVGRSAEFDLAVLDVNLSGELITPVAAIIEARGLPIVFATGYGAAGLPNQFRDHVALQKPFTLPALQAAIEAVTA